MKNAFGFIVLLLVLAPIVYITFSVIGLTATYVVLYILVHGLLALIMGGAIIQRAYTVGRLSSIPVMVRRVFPFVSPVWGLIVLGLVVDGVTGLRLVTNPFVFALSIFAVFYLLRRDRSRQSAGSNFRAGTMETGSSAAVVGDARKAPVRDYSGVVEDAHLISAPAAPVMPAMPNTRPLTEPVTLSKPAAPTSGPKPRDYSDLED